MALSVVHAVVLKPFWLPEDSKDNKSGSLLVSFPALQVLRDPGEELSEEGACSLSTLCAESFSTVILRAKSFPFVLPLPQVLFNHSQN